MADYKLQARISEELELQIKTIAEKIQKENPEAEASISTICRYALEDYIKRYNGKKNKNTLFLEIPIAGLNMEEMMKVDENIKSLKATIEDANTEERLLERKTEIIEIFKNEKTVKIMVDFEAEEAEEFFGNIEKAEKICDEKIVGFIRKKISSKDIKSQI